MVLGERIRQSRRDLQMTQFEFADHLGMTQATISNWENGAQMPTADALFQLADVTGDPAFVSREVLTGRPEPVERKPIKPPQPPRRGVSARLDAIERKLDLLLNGRIK